MPDGDGSSRPAGDDEMADASRPKVADKGGIARGSGQFSSAINLLPRANDARREKKSEKDAREFVLVVGARAWAAAGVRDRCPDACALRRSGTGRAAGYVLLV